MGSQNAKNIAVLQGNATVGRLMREYLEGSDFEVELLKGGPPGAARAQLVIVDVDSGQMAAQRWIRHCDGRQLPVIVSGVDRSRDDYRDRPWLSRPFSPDQLVALCDEVLGGGSGTRDEEIPPGIQVEPDLREQPTLEVPTASDDEEVGRGFQNRVTAQQSHEELLDALDLDGTGSMILEIEDLGGGEVGGMLVQVGQRRQLTTEELVETNPWADEPDTAVDLIDAESTAEKPTVASAMHSILDNMAGEGAGKEVTAVSSFRDVASGDFSSAHRVASLVAEYWDRLSLTARPADRSDRLQRIFTAMFRDGMEGVLDELKRIPDLSGFSGRLETMPVVDLLHTIRDRRLRGRLEVGLSGHSFVLYIDRSTLQAIDSLGENTDGLLLDLLYKQGALDEEKVRLYAKQLGTFGGEPLEMKLRRDQVVEESHLVEAKKGRARRLLDRMCRGDDGTFAFIEIRHDSGQSWPSNGLELNVDSLLLEILREGSLGDAKSYTLTRTDMVINSQRASSLSPDALTDEERKMLEFFQDGGSIDGARQTLADGNESVDRVVRRLERLELLRQLGKGSTTEESGEKSGELPINEQPTAVSSSWNLEILDEVESTKPDAWPDPLEAGPEEETQEDVSFSAGVPDDFSPANGRRSDGRDDDS